MKKTLGGIVVILLLLVSGTTPARAQSTDMDAATRAAFLAQIQSLTELLLQLQAQIASGNVNTSTDDSVFTETVTEGSENESIRLLQRVLATDPAVYPEARITGYFGSLTAAALTRFQQAWQIEATGTFTPETRFVLSAVLRDVPIETNAADYLQRPAVRLAITDALTEYLNRPTIVNGQVAFSANPDFGFAARNSDVATLQRVMATDASIYAPVGISGRHDAATAEAIIRLQTRYAIPVTGRVDTATRGVLETLLDINARPTIRPDLLRLAEAQPAQVIDSASRDILFVDVERDNIEAEVRVVVTYVGGLTERFTLPAASVRTDSAVISAVADRLNRTRSEVEAGLSVTVMETQELPRRIVFYLSRFDELTADIYFSDGENYDSTDIPEDIDFSVLVVIRGETMTLEEALTDFRQALRSGSQTEEELDEEIHQLIAEIYVVPIETVRSIELDYVVESN